MSMKMILLQLQHLNQVQRNKESKILVIRAPKDLKIMIWAQTRCSLSPKKKESPKRLVKWLLKKLILFLQLSLR